MLYQSGGAFSEQAYHILNKSAVAFIQVELCWTHGTMLSRMVVYLMQWQYWSSDVQLDARIARVSQALKQFGIDAF